MKTAEALQALESQKEGMITEKVHSFGETTIQIQLVNLKQALSFLKQNGFEVLMDLTGIDYVKPYKYIRVVYWLHNPNNYERLRLVSLVGREETLPTVTDLWEGAAWYERELYDLFGITFEGHPDLKRILMPDDWQGHPLLKDYALTEEPVEFKHNVKPKVPSKIIPYVKNKI